MKIRKEVTNLSSAAVVGKKTSVKIRKDVANLSSAAVMKQVYRKLGCELQGSYNGSFVAQIPKVHQTD